MREFLGEPFHVDRVGREFFRADAEQARGLYEFQRNWWLTRGQEDLDTATREAIVAQQSGSYTDLRRTPFVQAVRSSILKAAPGRTFSVLEIGAAVGELLDVMRAVDPSRSLRYTAFELLPLLVDEIRRRHPDAAAHQGGAEEFIAAADAGLAGAPHDLFVAALTICMIEPAVARSAIDRAAAVSRKLLIWDFLGNARGEIGGADTVVFRFGERRNPIFAHPFAAYLDDAGWRIQSTTAMNPMTKHDIGWGLIEAVPKEAPD